MEKTNSQAASTYSSAQWQKDFIHTTHAFILSSLDWIGVDFLEPSAVFEGGAAATGASSPQQQQQQQQQVRVRVLDYACGPGTMTSALWGRASEFVGVDLSVNMVKTYNERFAESESESKPLSSGGSFACSARAVVGDLLDKSGPSESTCGAEFFGFDLVVVGYGFHHFEDLELATGRLAERLRPGGVLLIVDFAPHEELEGGHPARHTVAHYGFGAEEVQSLFGGAGLVDVGVLEMEGMIEMKRPGAGDEEPGHKRKVFLGRGRKPL